MYLMASGQLTLIWKAGLDAVHGPSLGFKHNIVIVSTDSSSS
jgi:hypothetical protein